MLLLLLAAFGWGALHALSPGHGKAMVAAYLVGTRGTARHALILGATVTVTHTIGVFALGFVALALSAWVLPETLFPWLNLAAGLLVVVVGAGVARARIRERRGLSGGRLAHGHHLHEHAHDGLTHADRTHDHSHQHDHDHVHSHGGGKSHSHAPPEHLTPRGLIALGASAGLIPCPSALVVLLAAVAEQEILLGMALIVVFSLGLASTQREPDRPDRDDGGRRGDAGVEESIRDVHLRPFVRWERHGNPPANPFAAVNDLHLRSASGCQYVLSRCNRSASRERERAKTGPRYP